jgi:hypothetical protein
MHGLAYVRRLTKTMKAVRPRSSRLAAYFRGFSKKVLRQRSRCISSSISEGFCACEGFDRDGLIQNVADLDRESLFYGSDSGVGLSDDSLTSVRKDLE